MPYSPLTSIACLPLECYGCDWKCKYQTPHCVRQVAPEVIAEAIRQTLERSSEKPRVFIQGSSVWQPQPEQPKWKSFDAFLDVGAVEVIPVGESRPEVDRMQAAQTNERAPEVLDEINQFVEAGELEAASSAVSAAITQNQDSPALLNLQAELKFQLGDREQAKQILLNLVNRWPEYSPALNNLAVSHWEEGEPQKAVECLIKALEIDPDNRQTIRNCGDIYQALNRTEDARAIYASYLQRHPNDMEISQLLRELPEAPPESAVPSVIVDSDNEGSAIARLEQEIPQLLREIQGYGRESDTPKSTPDADADNVPAAEIPSETHEIDSGLTNVQAFQEMLDEIRQLRESGQLEAAGLAISRAIAHNPDSPALLNLQAELNFEMGNWEQAKGILVDVVNRWPTHSEALNNLAVIHWEEGETQTALEYLTKALEIDPNDRQTILNCGDIFTALNQRDDAKAIYSSYLQRHPGDEEIGPLLRELQEDSQNGETVKSSEEEGPGKEEQEESTVYDTQSAIRDAPIEVHDDKYLVTAIVSTYNSEHFIRGCLEDLEAQTIADRLEIIVIDSNSQQDEHAIVKEFQGRYDNIIYVRTAQREKIYAAWNRAIRLANGKYVTNANTDDRHLPNALEVQARALEMFPDVGLVSGDIWITDIENDTLAPNDTARFRPFRYPDFSLLSGLTGSNFSAQPMWRREAHDEVGFFDEAFTIAGDNEFFYRLARRFGAIHIRAPLGLYYENPEGIELSQPEATTEELSRLRQKFYAEMLLEEFFPSLSDFPNDASARAAALWELGNNCIRASMRPELELALEYYQQARDLIGDTRELLHNIAVAQIGSGRTNEGFDLLKRLAQDSAESHAVWQAIERAGRDNRIVPVEQWQRFYDPGHPVVEAGKKGRGVDLELLIDHEDEQVQPQAEGGVTPEAMAGCLSRLCLHPLRHLLL